MPSTEPRRDPTPKPSAGAPCCLAFRSRFERIASPLPLACGRVVERKIPSLEKVTRQHIFKPIVVIISNLGQGKAGPESSLLLDACTRNASVTLESFKYAPKCFLFSFLIMPPCRGLYNDADCNTIVERAVVAGSCAALAGNGPRSRRASVRRLGLLRCASSPPIWRRPGSPPRRRTTSSEKCQMSSSTRLRWS